MSPEYQPSRKIGEQRSSGYAMDGEAQGILDAGVLGFVQKPFRQETLANAVAEALGKGGAGGV